MSRLKRRLLIGAMFVVVIVIAAVAFFYRPTRLALERAEAFQLRRIQVTQQKDQGVYRFFFVTNRGLNDEKDEAQEERFSNQRQETLNFGLFDTAIEPTLGIAMLTNSTDWFQNEQIQLKQVKLLDQNSFVQQLRSQVDRSPFPSVLININGFRERFSSALRKTGFLGHVMDIDSPVLVFDRPGNQASRPRGYYRVEMPDGREYWILTQGR